MVTAACLNWERQGSPWEPARPIDELYALYKRLGVVRLGMLGNEEHLTADRPQDHTPFSVTAWPLPLPGYIVCACDAVNEVRGGVSLGNGLLREARRGKTPWMKYINFDNRQYHCRDGFVSWVYNGDRHVHVSGRTDHLSTGIGDLDPFGTGVQDMGKPFFVQKQGDETGAIWVVDGGTRRHITGEQMPRYLYAANHGWIELAKGGAVLETDDLDAFGPDITTLQKPGTLELSLTGLPIKLAGTITAELNEAGA